MHVRTRTLARTRTCTRACMLCAAHVCVHVHAPAHVLAHVLKKARTCELSACPPSRGGGADPPSRVFHSALPFLSTRPRSPRPHYRRRCWPPGPSRLVGPSSTGGGPSLPAPRSPTLSGQGTRQPRPDRCSSRKGWGPLLGGSPPGSWAPACVRLDPSARPTDAWWCLHASRALRDLTCTTWRRGRARSGELSPPGG